MEKRPAPVDMVHIPLLTGVSYMSGGDRRISETSTECVCNYQKTVFLCFFSKIRSRVNIPYTSKYLLRFSRCLDGMFLGAPSSYLLRRWVVFGCLGDVWMFSGGGLFVANWDD